MSILDSLRTFMSLEPLQERTILATPLDEYPSLAVQLQNLRRASPGPWRGATIKEALGVPAIFGAVNLIGNLTGSMSMKTYRGQVEMDPDDRPAIVVRPDPFRIPRRFYGPTAYNMASRGEAWWWVAARDGDGKAMSLLNIPPQEVIVEENPNDPRYPWVTWRNLTTKRPLPGGMRGASNDDFYQLPYAEDPENPLRGVGPLQMCGAAVSVAVESQIWAANFYAGGHTSLWVKTTIPLSGDPDDVETGEAEVDRFLDRWMAKDNNTPRVTDDTIEDIKEFNLNPQGAQMLDARQHQNVEVATMFNMDAELLNAVVAGTSLTYQNIGQRFDNLIKMCLRPNYLEVIEQTMSDLLSRSTTARFNIDFLTQSDPKTRWDIYNQAIPVIGQDEAAAMARKGEGLSGGDVENAAVPFSPPAAVPASVPMERSLDARCDGMRTFRRSGVTSLGPCNALLPPPSADGSRYCRKCKKKVYAAA